MLISWKYKFLFLHIPKTGGTALTRALAPYARKRDRLANVAINTPGLRHALVTFGDERDPGKTISGLGAHDRMPAALDFLGAEEIQPLRKIVFARNPFTHAYSLYAHVRRNPSNRHHDETRQSSFEDMVRSIYLPAKGFQHAYFHPGVHFDFVGCFEKLPDDALSLGEFLGLPRALVVPHVNANPQGDIDLRSLFDGVLDEFVDAMAAEFKFFGYSTDIDRAFEPPSQPPSPHIIDAAQWGDAKHTLHPPDTSSVS